MAASVTGYLKRENLLQCEFHLYWEREISESFIKKIVDFTYNVAKLVIFLTQ